MQRLDAGAWPPERSSQAIRFAPRREIVIVAASDGTPRVYLNECQHIPIPLDSGTRRFLDVLKTHLVCLTHGATYRVDTGECVAGPCDGDHLTRFDSEVIDGRLYVSLPEALFTTVP